MRNVPQVCCKVVIPSLFDGREEAGLLWTGVFYRAMCYLGKYWGWCFVMRLMAFYAVLLFKVHSVVFFFTGQFMFRLTRTGHEEARKLFLKWRA